MPENQGGRTAVHHSCCQMQARPKSRRRYAAARNRLGTLGGHVNWILALGFLRRRSRCTLFRGAEYAEPFFFQYKQSSYILIFHFFLLKGAGLLRRHVVGRPLISLVLPPFLKIHQCNGQPNKHMLSKLKYKRHTPVQCETQP